jgi:iron(III) transport system substrate-binding protein
MKEASLFKSIFSRKLIWSSATSVLVILGVTACAGSSGEQSLTIYSGRSESFIAPFFERFSQESGIKLDVRYGDSSAMAAQLLEEGENSPADLFISQDAGSLGAVSNSELFVELPNEILERVPSEYISSNKDWVGLTGRARVFAYSPDRVKELPKSIDDLTLPKWMGKIGIAPTNSSFQAFVTAMIESRGEAATEVWLNQLLKNKPIMFEKNSQIVAAIDNGQIDLGLVNHYYLWEVSKSLGREISVKNGFFAPKDIGNLINISGVAILKKSNQKDAAGKLIEFLLSDSSQSKFVSDTHEYSLVLKNSNPDGLPTLAEISAPAVDLSSLSNIKRTQALLIKVGLI